MSSLQHPAENRKVTTTPSVGDAVGMQRNWFAAIVTNNTELVCAEKLSRLGYECYVPSQKEMRFWRDGRRKEIHRILLPAIVLVRVTEKERRTIVHFPFIKRFLVNQAGKADEFNKRPVAVIPDAQIDILRFMTGNAESPVSIVPLSFRLGDKVRVIRGKLQGIEGHVLEDREEGSFLVVSLDLLGCAKVRIRPESLERL